MAPDNQVTTVSPLALKPQLGLFSAVCTGLAAILGTGIYFVITPAAAITGPSLILALLLAALVAYCNSMSSVQLAAVYPRTGGTYEFANHMIGPWAGFAAGWMFVVANTVGPGVIALAFGNYLHIVWQSIPARPAAVSAVLIMTVLNAVGIRQSASVTNAVVVISVLALAAVVVIGFPGGNFDNFTPFVTNGIGGVLHATALLFFAYTGYSRIATLVEEVKNPRRTIPRATVIALGLSTLLYLLVAGVAVAVLGTQQLAESTSPLAHAMLAVGSGLGIVIVAIGALTTTFNEGLTDLLGGSRVAFAMARGNDLPRVLVSLGAEKNPWHSVVFVGIVSILIAGFAPFGMAIAVSSLGTLIYYAFTNISALRLASEHRTHPRILVWLGLIGSIGLVLSLSLEEIGIGLGILGLGVIYRSIRHRGRRKQDTTVDSN
jgi:APA family basic amino acid/polyamine antiporter